MEIKRGIAVSSGVAIGPALVLDTEGFRIPKQFVESAKRDAEVARFQESIRAAAADARAHQDAISRKLGAQYGAIFGAHAFLIEDAGLRREVEALIHDQGFNAEYAVSRVMRRYVKTLEQVGGHIGARAADLFDIEKRLLSALLGQHRQELQRLQEPAIVLAHDLTPSETASLDTSHVHGFATEAGGRTSHTAIVAGVMQIPAVVGLGKFITDVSGGDLVIVDGNRGILILDPDDETLKRYPQTREDFRSFEHGLEELRDLPTQTRDGVRVQLFGNIEFPHESTQCLDRGADGVGLYRTEFLYLGKQGHPSEEEHAEAYRTVLRALDPKPVVIRTLDLGADKFPEHRDLGLDERNPALGLRSVRLCLRNLTLFKTQMRAILRASAWGDVRIMFPMVSTLLELRQCKLILADVKEDLEEEGIAFNPRVPVGTMIEVPAAALLAEQMAREVDFFSLGTNDLIQYTLAADRTNEAVASLYNPGDPAVLRLIDLVVGAARKTARVDVTVCGEMSGEPRYALLLVGMGVRQLSMTPHNIPEIKKVIRSVNLTEVETLAQDALRLETARDVNNFLREKTRRLLPDLFD
jgi:phosphotransferase system enzyme I (PtsI)